MVLDFSDRTRTGISILTLAADLFFFLDYRAFNDEFYEVQNCQSKAFEALKL